MQAQVDLACPLAGGFWVIPAYEDGFLLLEYLDGFDSNWDLHCFEQKKNVDPLKLDFSKLLPS